MKTQEEQIAFSEKLTLLTNNYAEIMAKIEACKENKAQFMELSIELGEAIKALDRHRDEYIDEGNK